MSDYTMNIGDTVPDLSCATWPEGSVNLKELHGQWIILYFYPKDSTSGCTTEACGFRDAEAALAESNTVVLGVSRDSMKLHQRFTEKQALNFPLISDADEALCTAFDVIQMKNMYGKKARGVERATFIINPKGVICHLWRKVKVKGHVDEVMQTLSTCMVADKV